MLLLFASVWPGIVILPAISILYFVLSSSLPISERTFASAHGLLILSSMAFALLASGKDGISQQAQLMFYMIIFIAFSSILYSCWAMNVRWFTHLFHIVTFWYILVATFFAGMLDDSF